MIGDTRFEFRNVIGAAEETAELDIKLISGPAQANTSTMPLSASELAEISSEAEKNKVALCCDSPLAQVARKGAWSFCPACGASTAS